MKLEDILSYDNVADHLDERQLNRIGSELGEGIEADLLSRRDWEERQEDALKLAMQVEEDKNFPWPGAANVKYPLLTTAAVQFSSRAYAALVPGINVVRVKITGYDRDGEKTKRAERIEKHMSYQLLEEMEDWEEHMDKLCVSLPILGCMFKKTYFSPIKRRNVSELVYPKDLIVNYWAKSLEDAYRKTHALTFSENDIYERVQAGLFLDQDYNKTQTTQNKTSDEIHGVRPPQEGDKSTPYEFYECHTYLDLDDDGYEEPYVVVLQKDTNKVARIVARFDEDSIITDDNDNLIRIEPIEYFTKFPFIPNPDGSFYDIGFGLLLGPINETINTTINQLLDAGTISNMQSGFLGKGIRIKGGNKYFEPGEWKVVQSTGDDLRKNIVPLPVREPSNVLFNLLGVMVESGQKLSSIVDMMLGENPGQNQPATTTMAVLEQGLKVFSSIYKRLYRSLKQEYRKLYELNKKYLPSEVYFRVLDDNTVAIDGGVEKTGQTDYIGDDTDIQPYADPNIVSQTQRLIKAQALMELLQVGTINPAVVTRRILEAQDQPNIDELMQMPPPSPPPEVQMEMQKFQDESARAWKELELEEERVKQESVKTDSNAILALAKAEAEELGQQLATYREEVNALKLVIDANREEARANERRVSGMERTPNNTGGV